MSENGNKNIQNSIEQIALHRPEYEFTTTDKIKHELWIIPKDDADKIQEYFEPIKEVYIADGHHRSASSAGLYKSKGNKYINSQKFLAYFVEEQQLNNIGKFIVFYTMFKVCYLICKVFDFI